MDCRLGLRGLFCRSIPLRDDHHTPLPLLRSIIPCQLHGRDTRRPKRRAEELHRRPRPCHPESQHSALQSTQKGVRSRVLRAKWQHFTSPKHSDGLHWVKEQMPPCGKSGSWLMAIFRKGDL
ncbi:unnamed protein product [Protopolystoma xenopodis]|uniref:Uncharacterized protein n=1 Tax=Protopolystoma xenopodis TaxID=117903 RepID=A0A448WXC9_9PLAT|nr:unnamed protein product [Protopolystoma xenopodis]